MVFESPSARIQQIYEANSSPPWIPSLCDVIAALDPDLSPSLYCKGCCGNLLRPITHDLYLLQQSSAIRGRERESPSNLEGGTSAGIPHRPHLSLIPMITAPPRSSSGNWRWPPAIVEESVPNGSTLGKESCGLPLIGLHPLMSNVRCRPALRGLRLPTIASLLGSGDSLPFTFTPSTGI